MLRLSLLLLLLPLALPAQSLVGDTIQGPANGFARALDYAADADRVIIGTPDRNANGLESGEVTVYELSGNLWTPVGQSFTGAAFRDFLGRDVAIAADGRSILIGAPGEETLADGAGAARFYEQVGGEWVQVGDSLTGDQTGEGCGARLAMSNDGRTIAVGCPNANGPVPLFNVGRTRVFTRSGDGWEPLGTEIFGTGASDGPQLEIDLAADGRTLAVASSWNAEAGFQAGHVRTFEYDGNDWVPRGQELRGVETNDLFGASVALSADGNRLAVGALASLGRATSPGYVRIFDYNATDTVWNQTAELTGESNLDFFGGDVALSDDGNTLIVGANGNDTNADDAGQARIYRFDGAVWAQLGATINGAERGDALGNTVAISGDGGRVAIGAPFAGSGRPGEAGQVLVLDTEGTTGVRHPALPTPLSLYPNPVSGQVLIIGTPTGEVLRWVEIFDFTGRRVLMRGGAVRRIDVGDLPAGQYFLRGRGEQGMYAGKLTVGR